MYIWVVEMLWCEYCGEEKNNKLMNKMALSTSTIMADGGGSQDLIDFICDKAYYI